MAAAAVTGLTRLLTKLGGGTFINPAAGKAGLPVASPVEGSLAKGVRSLSQMGFALQGVEASARTVTGIFGVMGKTFIALANPIGTVASLFGKTAQAGASLVSALSPIPAIAEATRAVAGALVQVGEAVSPVTMLNAAMESFVGVASAAIGHVSALGSAVAPLVAKANPAHLKLFEKAVSDAQASIGVALVPALQFSTALTRGLADVFFRLSGPMSRAMSSFFDPLSRALPDLLNKSEPLISLIGQLIERVGSLAGRFAEFLVKIANFGANLIEKFMGPSKGGLSGKSVGASVTNSTFGGVEEFWKTGAKNAFNLGTAGKGPEERTAVASERTNQILDAIKTTLDAIHVASSPVEMGKRLARRLGISSGEGGGVAETVWEAGRARGASMEAGLRGIGATAEADSVRFWMDRFRPSTG